MVSITLLKIDNVLQDVTCRWSVKIYIIGRFLIKHYIFRQLIRMKNIWQIRNKGEIWEKLKHLLEKERWLLSLILPVVTYWHFTSKKKLYFVALMVNICNCKWQRNAKRWWWYFSFSIHQILLFSNFFDPHLCLGVKKTQPCEEVCSVSLESCDIK